jgi:Mrp family chromosome partitioning ATPase
MNIEDVPTVLLVASGKGGVGKTTVASDIARIAHDDGMSVGLIDADISTPNSPEVIGGEEADVDGQRLATGESLVPPVVNGIQVMSQGTILPDDVAVLRDGEWRAGVVMDYLQNVEWNDDTDVVVIDSPPGSGEELQVVTTQSPITHGIIVTTPHPSAVRDATRTHEFFTEYDVPHSAVVNMAYIPATDVVSHVSNNVDRTAVKGVGPATEESLDELAQEETPHMPLFGYDFGETVDVGAEVEAIIPYTSHYEFRAKCYGDIPEAYYAEEEVTA